jgi:hypothetical protein
MDAAVFARFSEGYDLAQSPESKDKFQGPAVQ